jgi:hypothetical protein
MAAVRDITASIADVSATLRHVVAREPVHPDEAATEEGLCPKHGPEKDFR